MVWRRVVIMSVFLVMSLLISSQLAETRELTQTSITLPPNESERIGSDARFECPNGCCGVASPYCRCCSYPAQHPNNEAPANLHN